jgi:hypothetical protein
VTNRLRETLAADLDKAIRQAGVVVWQDEHCEYAEVARSVCPPDGRMAVFEGSWYELRRSVEDLLAGDTPPTLLVYAPVVVPAEDPLAEIRAAGKVFKKRLATLVRRALEGEMAAARIEQIAKEARTFEEAEAAASGAEATGVRLISIFGVSDATAIALAVLARSCDDSISKEGAWGEVASMLGDAFGGNLGSEAADLCNSFRRHVLLADIAAASGALPQQLSAAFSAPTTDQRRRIRDLLQQWRYLPDHASSYKQAAIAVDEQLSLRSVLTWTNGLETCMAAPSVEIACLAEAAQRLERREGSDALVLAEARLVKANPWRDDPSGAAGGGR